jgi:hypothetical protein
LTVRPLLLRWLSNWRTAISVAKGHVWTAPAVQEESDLSAKRSGAAMYSACFRVEACPFAMQPLWLLALM